MLERGDAAQAFPESFQRLLVDVGSADLSVARAALREIREQANSSQRRFSEPDTVTLASAALRSPHLEVVKEAWSMPWSELLSDADFVAAYRQSLGAGLMDQDSERRAAAWSFVKQQYERDSGTHLSALVQQMLTPAQLSATLRNTPQEAELVAWQVALRYWERHDPS